ASRRPGRSTQSSSIPGGWGLNPPAPSTPRPPALLTAATTSRQCVKAKMGYSIPNWSQSGVLIASSSSEAEILSRTAGPPVAATTVRPFEGGGAVADKVKYQPSHFGICVTDLERSMRFYCDGLGFEPAERYDLEDWPDSGLDRGLEVQSPVKLVSQFIRSGGMGIELLFFESPTPSGTPSASR